MKKLSGILLFASLLLFSACKSFFKVEIIVDNPNKTPITLIFDGEEHEIPGQSNISLNIVKGEHQIAAAQEGEEIFNETISITGPGVLNPTKSTYVVHKELYLLDQSKYDEYAASALKRQDHQIANKTYEDVDFEVFEGQAFLGKNWDFGVEKELPEEIKTSAGEYEVISKLYRLADLEKAWGFYGDFDFTQTSDTELKQFLDSLANNLAVDTIQ